MDFDVHRVGAPLALELYPLHSPRFPALGDEPNRGHGLRPAPERPSCLPMLTPTEARQDAPYELV